MQPVNASPLVRQEFHNLQGWMLDDHDAALKTFRRSCREIIADGSAFSRAVSFGGTKSDWIGLCHESMTAKDSRGFFETHFVPYRVNDAERPAGLFTGYYEPEAQGAKEPGGAFTVPVYGRPGDLVTFDRAQRKRTGLDYGRVTDGIPRPYFSRMEIERGALKGRGLELLWLREWADAFFMQIQGSGSVRLPDGSIVRLSYAAKSGRAYTGIGALLVERGVFTREQMSMQAIRAWMNENPEKARHLMWENQSFVFFREVRLEDPDLGALGAQHVQLTPERSIAVDRNIWMFGTPVWLETAAPAEQTGGLQPFHKLLIAQDTGTAIKGHARGDVYWGSGETAGHIAGLMKSPGKMIVLLPKSIAQRLGLKS